MVTPLRRVAVLALCTASTLGAQRPTPYDVEIRWTSYGIPHVKAANWGSLGYGFAYATATDAFCTIARDVMTVNGESSRYFGPGEGRSDSDVFHRAMLDATIVRRFNATQDAKSNRFTDGYVAGYNRYLRDHRDSLPKDCRGAAWVRPITVNDVTKLTIGFGIRYGVGRYQKEMATAAPPGELRTGSITTDFTTPEGIGSNAVAMGRDVTASGRGLLLGNPHYPWQGSSRFHLIHTTIPGEVDVMGASLYSTSRVAIGFNKDIAWSHTVSTGVRSTIYALELKPDDPTQYRYGTTWRRMTRVQVAVPVKAADGSATTAARTTWFTHYGPVVASEQLPWTAARAYAVRDVNLGNDRSAATYDRLSRARTVDEVDAAIREQGVAFTNTIAADRAGTAYYADISLVPNLDAATLERCRVKPAGVPASVVVLNGADVSCEWKPDPRAKVAGAMPPALMPSVRRTDVVSNANDSYWLSTPAAKLEGFSPIIGDERTARSLRTRAGLAFIDEALKNGQKATPQTLESMLFSHRNFGAELLLDDLLTICAAPLEPVVLSGRSEDIGPACAALRQWDRKETVESRGAQVWREFWRQAARVPGLYRVPFDPNDAANTPRGLAVEQPGVREAARRALARAVQLLRQANVAPDATLGSIQYDMRGNERIPIPGGQGGTGMWSVITTDLTPKGYTPIIHGNSYIQIVGWSAEGAVEARGIVTYSQSDDPDSPHFGDLTRLYSKGQMIRLPFTEAEIAADPGLRSVRLRQ
jgi:acyl-homoserine-lactone acylase